MWPSDNLGSTKGGCYLCANPRSLFKFQNLFLFLLLPLGLWAQDMRHYKPLQSAYPIPQEFRQLSSEKYSSSKRKLNRERDGKERTRDKDDFLLESNFVLNQLLTSGRVLFNDSVSLYLAKVLNVVLKDAPTLRASVRVYALRSSVVNAFTTDDGVILISLGLLAQLEDEAQLAFILCHELVHFEHDHIINAYVENLEIKQGRGVHGRSSFDERILAGSHYSKELEKEADQAGLTRFLRSGYSTASISKVFDVMRYAHLPFDDVPFDRTFFNHDDFKVSDSYFLDKVKSPEPLDGKEVADATHPSPSERQAIVGKLIPEAWMGKGDAFIVSEKEFRAVREMARFELTRLYLMSNQPVMAIYNAFLLLRTHDANAYLNYQVGRALYMLAKFKMAGRLSYVHPGFTGMEGESQQLFHLFYRLPADELCVLAVGHIWRLRLQYPDNADLVAMSEDLLRQLMLDHYLPGMFSQTAQGLGIAPTDTLKMEQLSKYDRLRLKQMDDPRYSMLRYAFVDLFANANFAAQFDKWEREKWMGKKGEVTPSALEKKKREDQRKWKNTGFHLGIDKVVMVSPAYAKLDLRKRQQHNFLDAEEAKLELLERMTKSAKLLALDATVLEATMLDSDKVDVFNDISFLNEWVDQRLSHMDVDMVSLDRQRLDGLIARYGTEHFAWTGVINYRENKPLLYFYLLYALVPPAIPLAIYYLIRPNYDTYYYCLTFNLRTGEPSMIAYSNFRLKDAQDIINSNVYDSMWQMKSKPRTKQ